MGNVRRAHPATVPALTILIEAAVDTVESAERAVAEGAHRLEVCARLDLGGLTPPADLLRQCLAIGVPVAAMARPRPGDFLHNEGELAQLLGAVGTICDAGAAAVVFGVLTHDRRVDPSATKAVVACAAGRETVFHRAFDQASNPLEVLGVLVECGVTRVLTSGGAATAYDGTDMLASLSTAAGDRIEILAGGGIRGHNVAEIIERTGVRQVHARATEPGVIAGIRAAIDRR